MNEPAFFENKKKLILYVYRLPLWVLITTRAIYFLNCTNFSLNLLIYFVIYSSFRDEIKLNWQKIKFTQAADPPMDEFEMQPQV